MKTRAANKSAVKTLRKAFGPLPLIEVTPLHIEAHLRARLGDQKTVRRKEGIAKLPKTVKPTTVHQEFRVLRRIFSVAVKKKLCRVNPCSAVEFPVSVKGLFRPHYMSWSEQQLIETNAPAYLRNVILIITETGLRVYKELAPMRKDQVDLANRVVFIPDSKTPTGVAEVPLTSIAAEGVRKTDRLSRARTLAVSERPKGRRLRTQLQEGLGTHAPSGEGPVLQGYDLRSTFATRLSAGGVADEWVTQLLRQTDAQVFKKYSQMKLGMKREALTKLNREANESEAKPAFDTDDKE